MSCMMESPIYRCVSRGSPTGDAVAAVVVVILLGVVVVAAQLAAAIMDD